jgi:hypothetical protein
MSNYVIINFSQYEQFMDDFRAILLQKMRHEHFKGMLKSEIFCDIMERDFDMTLYVIPGEPFWVAHVRDTDAVDFLLKYS